MSEPSKPRDLYELLVLVAAQVGPWMYSAIRPAITAWHVMSRHRHETETGVALRAVTRSRSYWRAVAWGVGLLVLLNALHILLWRGFFQFAHGEDARFLVFGLQHPLEILRRALLGILTYFTEPRLWFAICLVVLIRRYLASDTWKEEIKVLPIGLLVVARRIMALLFVAAVLLHLFNYLFGIIYIVIYMYVTNNLDTLDVFWPLLIYRGVFYFDRMTAGLPEILINETTGHIMAVFFVFFHMTAAMAIAIHVRNVILAAGTFAVAYWMLQHLLGLAYFPVQSGLRWMAGHFLQGDDVVRAGQILTPSLGFLAMLLALGLLCRLMERRMMQLMEE